MEAYSYQQWLARLPIRERGMGLRSLVDTSPAAFIGAVEMALSFFTRGGGRALSTSGAPNRGCQGNRGGQQMEEPHLLWLQVGGYKPVPLGQERLGLPGPLHCSGELV